MRIAREPDAASQWMEREYDKVLSRAVCIGGMTKRELLSALQRNAIQLNEIAEVLFAHKGFETSEARSTVEAIDISVGELGHTRGATIAQVFDRAAERGLALCPLELAAHLRLQFTDQPEGFWGHPVSRNCAPSGALTVAARPLATDDGVSMGFYLRRIRGVLWLRGYRSPAEHVWDADDRFVFCRQSTMSVP